MSRPASTFLRGSVLSIVGMVATMACGLAAAVIFTHAFDRAGDNDSAGVFATLILISELFTLVNNFGLVSTLPKLVAAAPDAGRPRVTWSALYYQSLTSVVIGAAVIGFWALLPGPDVISENETWIRLYPYLWALPLLILFGNLRENALAALAGFDRYGARAAGLVATAVANVALIGFCVWVMAWGLTGLIWATVATYSIGAAWFCLGLPGLRRNALAWPEYKKALAFSSPLYANSLLGFVFLRCDTLIVAWLMGPAQAAYFEFVAKRFTTYLNRLLVAALTPFLPGMSALAAQRDYASATAMFNAASFTFTVAGYTAVLGLVGVQEWLIGLLFPAEYASALSVMGLVLAAGVLNVQAGIAGQSLVALERPRIITIVNVSAALLSLACNAVLIPVLGILGAGVAAIAAGAFSNGAQVWAVTRTGIRVSWLRFAALHGLFAVGLAIATARDPGVVTLAVPFVFLAGCFGMRIVQRNDLAELAGRRHGHATEPTGHGPASNGG